MSSYVVLMMKLETYVVRPGALGNGLAGCAGNNVRTRRRLLRRANPRRILAFSWVVLHGSIYTEPHRSQCRVGDFDLSGIIAATYDASEGEILQPT